MKLPMLGGAKYTLDLSELGIMTELILIKDDEQVGYIDTEAGEGGYMGDDPFVRGLVNSQVGKYLGGQEGQPNGPSAYFTGEELAEYIRGLPDEHEEVEFAVRERSEVDFDIEEYRPD
jgi:hypothetical protein